MPHTNRAKGEGSLYQHTDGRWMYSLMHEGKRLVRSLKTRDESEAQQNYIKVRREFAAKIERGELDPANVKNFTIGELASRYLDHMRENGRKSADIAALTLGVIQRDKTFPPNRKVCSLTTTDFKEYRKRESAVGVAAATINYRFKLLRAALRLEAKQTPSCVGALPFIPIVSVDNAREGFLDYEDYPALRDELPASLKTLFVVAMHSGCRLGELLNMRWEDVDWKQHIIRLPKTKNGKKRNLPFWGDIESFVQEQKQYRDAYHHDQGFLFFWRSADCGFVHGGVRLAPGDVIKDFRASWANAVTRAHTANANIKADLLFHDLRRSAVRFMVQDAGIPESQAMLISGHLTRTMLERYNIVSLKNVQDAAAKLDAASKRRKSK